jgi:hypothetical protein
MAMHSFTFNFKRFPWACINAIVVVFAVQFTVASHPWLQNALFVFSEASLSDPMRVRYFLEQAKQDTGKKALIVGTSQSREGFDVRILNGHFKDDNITFYNMGSAAYSAADLYMEIDRILNVAPDLIIYMPYIGNFYLDYDFKRLKYYYHPKIISVFLEKVGNKPLVENGWFFFDAYLSYISYFYKYREELKPVLYNVLNYLAFRIGEKVEPKYFRYDENFPPEYFARQVEQFKGKKFYISEYTEVEQHAFKETIRAIKESETPFLVIDAPVNPLIKNVYKPEVEIAYEDFLTKILRDAGIPFLSRNDLPDFGMDKFIDFTHLNAVGRAQLTEFLSDYLQKNYTAIVRRQQTKTIPYKVYGKR